MGLFRKQQHSPAQRARLIRRLRATQTVANAIKSRTIRNKLRALPKAKRNAARVRAEYNAHLRKAQNYTPYFPKLKALVFSWDGWSVEAWKQLRAEHKELKKSHQAVQPNSRFMKKLYRADGRIVALEIEIVNDAALQQQAQQLLANGELKEKAKISRPSTEINEVMSDQDKVAWMLATDPKAAAVALKAKSDRKDQFVRDVDLVVESADVRPQWEPNAATKAFANGAKRATNAIGNVVGADALAARWNQREGSGRQPPPVNDQNQRTSGRRRGPTRIDDLAEKWKQRPESQRDSRRSSGPLLSPPDTPPRNDRNQRGGRHRPDRVDGSVPSPTPDRNQRGGRHRPDRVGGRAQNPTSDGNASRDKTKDKSTKAGEPKPQPQVKAALPAHRQSLPMPLTR